MSEPEEERGIVPAALVKRLQTEEKQAIDALARWIGHPGVRDVIEHRRGDAEQAVAPIDRLLTSQTAVIYFCLHIYGLAGIEPGWELRRAPVWQLTTSEMSAIEQVKADLRAVIQLTLTELEEAGAGVVPNWAGDHVVVGELLLLDIDWNFPARQLAEDLQPPAIGAIHPDASGAVHRRGTWERAETNLAAVRRAYERHLHGQPTRAPYAAGGSRATPEPTRRRREALAKVLEKWPGATASQIATTFGDHGLQRGRIARSPGGYLRQLLEADAPTGEIVPCPAKSTLHEDLRALRGQARQKQSG